MGLCDVSRVVDHDRLGAADVDLDAYRRLASWGVHALARPAFGKAVASYVPT